MFGYLIEKERESERNNETKRNTEKSKIQLNWSSILFYSILFEFHFISFYFYKKEKNDHEKDEKRTNCIAM